MKAIGIAGAEDLAQIDVYSGVADQLLIDAKPPKDATLPGGNGLSFDWRLLAGRKYWTKPWMLAGGPDAGQRGRGGAPDRRETGGPEFGHRKRPGRQGPREDAGLRRGARRKLSDPGTCPAAFFDWPSAIAR
jgi:hypothetical protein